METRWGFRLLGVIPAMLSYKPIGDLVLRAELLLVGCVVPDFAVTLVVGYSDFEVVHISLAIDFLNGCCYSSVRVRGVREELRVNRSLPVNRKSYTCLNTSGRKCFVFVATTKYQLVICQINIVSRSLPGGTFGG